MRMSDSDTHGQRRPEPSSGQQPANVIDLQRARRGRWHLDAAAAPPSAARFRRLLAQIAKAPEHAHAAAVAGSALRTACPATLLPPDHPELAELQRAWRDAVERAPLLRPRTRERRAAAERRVLLELLPHLSYSALAALTAYFLRGGELPEPWRASDWRIAEGGRHA
jgi:hypothetical protein